MAKKSEKGGHSAPHQVAGHPAVNNPKNHPATQMKPATQQHDGTQMPGMPLSGLPFSSPTTGPMNSSPPPQVVDRDNDGF